MIIEAILLINPPNECMGIQKELPVVSNSKFLNLASLIKKMRPNIVTSTGKKLNKKI